MVRGGELRRRLLRPSEVIARCPVDRPLGLGELGRPEAARRALGKRRSRASGAAQLGHCRWRTLTLRELVEQARLGLLEQLERGRRFRVARLVRVAAQRQLAEALGHLLLAHVPNRLSREVSVRLGQLQPVEVVGRAQDRRDLLRRATRSLPTTIEHHAVGAEGARRRRGGREVIRVTRARTASFHLAGGVRREGGPSSLPSFLLSGGGRNGKATQTCSVVSFVRSSSRA